jgi:hypothetical protein
LCAVDGFFGPFDATLRIFMREKPSEPSSGNLVLLLLFGPLLLAGLCQLAKAGQYLLFHGDSTFPESAVAQTALWAKASGRIYPALEQTPYTPAPYGPLFYAGLTTVAKVIGGDIDRLLVVGRLATFSAFLLLLFATYRWGKRQMLAGAIAFAAPLLLMSQIDFEAWNATVRPDLAALLLTFAAFFVLTTAPVSWRRALLAGCLCGLAGLLKQSFIALPLTGLLWLFTTRQRRAALAFLAGMVAIAIAVFLPLALRHEPFVHEMLLARYSPISFFEAVRLVKTDFLTFPGQIVLLGLGLLGLARMNANAPAPRSLVTTYFFLAWAANFYTAMAPGASMNAFLEAWVITSVCAPFALRDLLQNWEHTAATVRAVVLLLWITVMVLDLNYWRTVLSVHPPAEYGKLAQIVAGRRVLSDVPYVVAHGERPELLDPSVNHYLEIARQWSPKPLVDDLQRGSFDYVIVGLNGRRARQWRGLTLFSPSILAQIEAGYRPLCVSERVAVYVPRTRAVADRTEDLKKAGCQPVLPSDPPIELLQR